MATIKIPPVLRASVGGEKQLNASGENVGAGATTRSPLSSVTARDAWISSFEPFPTRMPSGGQSNRAASSSSSWVGVNSG